MLSALWQRLSKAAIPAISRAYLRHCLIYLAVCIFQILPMRHSLCHQAIVARHGHDGGRMSSADLSSIGCSYQTHQSRVHQQQHQPASGYHAPSQSKMAILSLTTLKMTFHTSTSSVSPTSTALYSTRPGFSRLGRHPTYFYYHVSNDCHQQAWQSFSFCHKTTIKTPYLCTIKAK